MSYTTSGWLLAALGTLIVLVGFFVALGSVVAQVPICGPNGTCTEVDYLAAAVGIGAGVVIAGAGGWVVQRARS